MSFRSTQKSIEFLAEELKAHPKASLATINVLMTCLDHDGITGSELCERVDMPRSTLWRSLAFFTEWQEAGKAPGMNWLTRDEVQTTGREVNITLTPEGKKIKKMIESL